MARGSTRANLSQVRRSATFEIVSLLAAVGAPLIVIDETVKIFDQASK
jgi:hypothetical protein